MKTVDLFIRTYAGDAPWLAYCLRAVRKFCHGFEDLVVTCPESSREVIAPLAAAADASFHVCPQLHEHDYVGQQATKMTADTWCKADAICYVDSDVIFTREFTPADVLDDDRVRLLKTPYSCIKTPWQSLTIRDVGFHVDWEYMRRFPLSHARQTLEVARRHMEWVHHKPFEHYMREIPGRGFSEFNVLGAVADRFLPDQYSLLDTTTEPLPETHARQFWSHGGLTPQIVEEIENVLA